MEFLSEPWAPIVLGGVISSILWLFIWVYMKVEGRFDEAALGGLINLAGGLVVTILFGAVVLVVGALFLAVLSVFWMLAAATGTFETERKAIQGYLSSKKKASNGKGAKKGSK